MDFVICLVVLYLMHSFGPARLSSQLKRNASDIATAHKTTENTPSSGLNSGLKETANFSTDQPDISDKLSVQFNEQSDSSLDDKRKPSAQSESTGVNDLLLQRAAQLSSMDSYSVYDLTVSSQYKLNNKVIDGKSESAYLIPPSATTNNIRS